MVVACDERPVITIACHCLDCQRRTGAPFGVLAYYRADRLDIAGEARAYRRVSAEGNAVDAFFCPHCGSTVYVTLSKQPGLIGVSMGCIGDPDSTVPRWSVWERSRHDWIDLKGEMQHFAQGDQVP